MRCQKLPTEMPVIYLTLGRDNATITLMENEVGRLWDVDF